MYNQWYHSTMIVLKKYVTFGCRLWLVLDNEITALLLEVNVLNFERS